MVKVRNILSGLLEGIKHHFANSDFKFCPKLTAFHWGGGTGEGSGTM